MLFICTEFGVGLTDMDLYIYNGATYQKVIRQDTFQTNLALFLENPPTEDVTNKAPTSEWAYDHWKDTTLHAPKYTDAEAVGAFYNRKLTLTTGTYTDESMTGISYLELDTSGGDITIEGLADGTEGQMIFCVKGVFGNHVDITHGDAGVGANDKIYCVTAGNESIAAGHYGCFWLVYQDSKWFIDHTLI